MGYRRTADQRTRPRWGWSGSLYVQCRLIFWWRVLFVVVVLLHCACIPRVLCSCSCSCCRTRQDRTGQGALQYSDAVCLASRPVFKQRLVWIIPGQGQGQAQGQQRPRMKNKTTKAEIERDRRVLCIGRWVYFQKKLVGCVLYAHE